MGYSTDFTGAFTITPPLTGRHRAYLVAFADQRHMIRDPDVMSTVRDDIRTKVGLPVGPHGDYCVGNETGVLNDSNPPPGVPGLWCQWVPSEDGESLAWDEGEKFYHYTEWLVYYVEHFFKPWGYTLNGEVAWEGEENYDTGTIYAQDNQIDAVADKVKKAKKPKKR